MKQIYLVNKLIENLKLFKKLHVNIFHINMNKNFRHFFQRLFFLSKLLYEIKQYSGANEKSYFDEINIL